MGRALVGVFRGLLTDLTELADDDDVFLHPVPTVVKIRWALLKFSVNQTLNRHNHRHFIYSKQTQIDYIVEM